MYKQLFLETLNALTPNAGDKQAQTAQAIAATALGFLGAYFQNLTVPLIMLVIFTMLDYATGMLKAWQKGCIESPKGWLGVLKKLAYFVVVTVGIGLDWLVILSTHAAGIEFPLKNLFAWALAFWLILNEMISICENLAAIGVRIPKFLLKRLKTAQEKIESEKEDKEDKTKE